MAISLGSAAKQIYTLLLLLLAADPQLPGPQSRNVRTVPNHRENGNCFLALEEIFALVAMKLLYQRAGERDVSAMRPHIPHIAKYVLTSCFKNFNWTMVIRKYKRSVMMLTWAGLLLSFFPRDYAMKAGHSSQVFGAFRQAAMALAEKWANELPHKPPVQAPITAFAAKHRMPYPKVAGISTRMRVLPDRLLSALGKAI
ncbi:caffeine resistance protein, MFS transporter [Histoplasma ohiense]|nr:caffeine resistance protein, MFS transporter [Histoplasma ohiense (nom. inval.)]